MVQKYIDFDQLGQVISSFNKFFKVDSRYFRENHELNSNGFEYFAGNARIALGVASDLETGTGKFDLNKSNRFLNNFIYWYNKMEEVIKFQQNLFYGAIQRQQEIIEEAKQAGYSSAVIEFNKEGLRKGQRICKYFQTELVKFEKFDAEFEKITGTSLAQLRKSAKKHTKLKEQEEAVTV